jgi:hypothetical protein
MIIIIIPRYSGEDCRKPPGFAIGIGALLVDIKIENLSPVMEDF